MNPIRQKGAVYSAVLHFFLLLFALFGLPNLFDRTRDTDPQVITVELLPITGVTNVKPMETPPAPKPEEKPEEKKPEPEKKPTPPVKTSTPPPPLPPQEKISPKVEKKKPDEKKPEPKKEEKKPKPKDKDPMDNLDAVLKAVQQTANTSEKKEPAKSETDDTSKVKNNSSNFDPTQQMSLSEKDAIRSQIAKCWNVPAGAKDAHELLIVLTISVEQDGTVTKVALANESKDRYSQDAFFRAAADSAMRAVRQCSPLKDLPPDKYNTWRDIELTFDPREMLY
ncbi:MAG: hypothetical protein SFT92_06995 [Rickettsiales bacterium]|nr:hypothetical protein [Rickettsiales bacterium]